MHAITKLYGEPIEVECRGLVPLAFTWRGSRHRIHQITNRWVLRTDWWRQEVARRYWKVECEEFSVFEIYQHQTGWVLERVYD